MVAELSAALRAAVGGEPAALLEDPESRAAAARDWLGRIGTPPVAIARPRDAGQVAALLRAAQAERLPVIPRGGNTGLVRGAITTAPHLLLCLSRMGAIRALDAVGDMIVVEAGCTLAVAQAAAAAAGRKLPFGMGSEGSATIGGMLSTNAGGHAALAHGVARDLVLGLEAVLPDGTLLGGPRMLRKDNTGIDVARLLVGAEGTLGVITAATLRLVTAPRERVTAWIATADIADAMRLLVRLREGSGPRLVAFEVMLDGALRLLRDSGAMLPLAGQQGVCALVEWEDVVPGPALQALAEQLLSAALEDGVAADAALAASGAQAAAMWRLRESLSELQGGAGRGFKHDIALPPAALPAFVAEAEAALRAAFPALRLVAYGHAGDGNLHWNLLAEGQAAEAEGLRVTRLVHDLVGRHGGSFSAEHGIGRSKAEELARRTPAARLDAMRRLKRALDPEGLMNPGAVLAPATCRAE